MRYNLADAQQQALGFLTHQLTIIEPTVYKIQYPEVQYPQLIPLDMSGNEWARSVTFFSVDSVGKAKWFAASSMDIPYADITREKFEQTIGMAAIGYQYNMEELANAMQLRINLTADKAEACRRAYMEFVDDVALRGDADKGWQGLINHSAVTVVDLPTDSASDPGSPAWSDKTVEQIIRDVNLVLLGVYTASLTVEIADTLLLPIAALNELAIRVLPSTSMTALDFLAKNNHYTFTTGRPLKILGVRGLETAGDGNVGRMVAYRRDPQVLKLHIPMPFKFEEPWRRAPLVYDIPGIFRLGGLEIRRPAAIRYADGLLNAAYE